MTILMNRDKDADIGKILLYINLKFSFVKNLYVHSALSIIMIRIEDDYARSCNSGTKLFFLFLLFHEGKILNNIECYPGSTYIF